MPTAKPMRVLRDIIKKEILDNITSPKFVFTFLLCAVLILLSVYTGVANYGADKKEYTAAVALNNMLFSAALTRHAIDGHELARRELPLVDLTIYLRAGYYKDFVVALVRPGYRLTLNEHEVADAFEVPLAFLMDPAHHHRHAMDLGGARREWYSMPYVDAVKERFIWGATAAMLRNFYRFLAA
mgnify:CR=1 FL=1